MPNVKDYCANEILIMEDGDSLEYAEYKNAPYIPIQCTNMEHPAYLAYKWQNYLRDFSSLDTKQKVATVMEQTSRAKNNNSDLFEHIYDIIAKTFLKIEPLLRYVDFNSAYMICFVSADVVKHSLGLELEPLPAWKKDNKITTDCLVDGIAQQFATMLLQDMLAGMSGAIDCTTKLDDELYIKIFGARTTLQSWMIVPEFIIAHPKHICHLESSFINRWNYKIEKYEYDNIPRLISKYGNLDEMHILVSPYIPEDTMIVGNGKGLMFVPDKFGVNDNTVRMEVCCKTTNERYFTTIKIEE